MSDPCDGLCDIPGRRNSRFTGEGEGETTGEGGERWNGEAEREWSLEGGVGGEPNEEEESKDGMCFDIPEFSASIIVDRSVLTGAPPANEDPTPSGRKSLSGGGSGECEGAYRHPVSRVFRVTTNRLT